MLLTVLGIQAPVESGPTSTCSPTRSLPECKTPFTTVPTYGTDQISVIEYWTIRISYKTSSAVLFILHLQGLIDSKLVNVSFAGR